MEASVLILIFFAGIGVPVDTTYPTRSFLSQGENCLDSRFYGREDRPIFVPWETKSIDAIALEHLRQMGLV